jgi:hypothetical protein
MIILQFSSSKIIIICKMNKCLLRWEHLKAFFEKVLLQNKIESFCNWFHFEWNHLFWIIPFEFEFEFQFNLKIIIESFIFNWIILQLNHFLIDDKDFSRNVWCCQVIRRLLQTFYEDSKEKMKSVKTFLIKGKRYNYECLPR